MTRADALRRIVLCCTFVYMIAPIWAAVAAALSAHGSPAFAGPVAYPSSFTLQNLRLALQRGHPVRCFANSMVLATVSASLGTILGFPAAYLISRSRSRWKGVALTALLLIRLQPKMPAIAAQYHVVSAIGLLDNPLSVALVRGGGILLAIWLMKTAIDGVPQNLEQTALLDGLSRWQVVGHVTIPLAASGIAAAFLLEFASAWNSFLLPLLFLSSEARMTVPLGIDRFLSSYAVEQGPLMAFTLLVSLPLLVVFPRLLVELLAPCANRGQTPKSVAR